MDAPRLGGEIAADILGLRFDPAAKLGQRLFGRRGRSGQIRTAPALTLGAIRSFSTAWLPHTAQAIRPFSARRS